MPEHRRPLIRRTRFEAAVAVGMTIAFAGCTSGSDAIPVPGADDVITAPVASVEVAPATVVTETSEISTTAPPEPVATEPIPDTAPTTTPTATTSSTTAAATTDGASTVPVTAPPADDVFLRLGDEGDEVGLMQFKLSVLDYLPTGADTGVFDEATETGLRSFQSDYGLGVDGVFGPITGRALNAAVQSVQVET